MSYDFFNKLDRISERIPPLNNRYDIDSSFDGNGRTVRTLLLALLKLQALSN
jgi:hypothetical protein